ncbi:MAG: hypothetical protein M1825_001199 [Sarcosagium campestre]|nr:MAG: hypothetical protein M1825_001199 [Sarcosagium campestre]
MSTSSISLIWSTQLSVTRSTPPSSSLSGDKISLPPSALEQLLSAATTITTELDPESSRPSVTTFDPFNPHSYASGRDVNALGAERQQILPQPLTFRLVNPKNGRIVYAGIKEFSAEEGEVGLSPFLQKALDLTDKSTSKTEANGISSHASSGLIRSPRSQTDGTAPLIEAKLTIHAAELPKGTYVRLRPLEAGYDAEDWKSLLEQHLRANYTTLTNGEILVLSARSGRQRSNEEFRFLIDKFEPAGDAICVVDTDLEVDIEALNEEQARETLQRRHAKTQTALGAVEGSSIGGDLILGDGQEGQVRPGDYVDYQLPQWDRTKSIQIEIDGAEGDGEIDLFISPFSARQRARPRDDEHVFGDFSSQYPKIVRIDPTNIELQDAEALWISLSGYQPIDDKTFPQSSEPRRFRILASIGSSQGPSHAEMETRDETRCKNCQQLVPKQSMILHENFCFRNNVYCPHCRNVFKKSSDEWKNHWHCEHDSAHGDSPQSKGKHDDVSHTPRTCPGCGYEAPNLPQLALHRISVCPGKLILCQFCHLVVPQEGDPNSPNAEALLANLTAHELADGGRTTDCHICKKIVRLRDMSIHLRHHDLERKSRTRPQKCRNANCGRAIAVGRGAGNDLGLCSICFGPLYISLYDPEGKALKRRVERRYLSQLLSGCGKAWCRNSFCKTGRRHSGANGAEAGKSLATKDAMPLIKPFVDALKDNSSPLHFCVDETSQRRKNLAETMAAQDVGPDGYDIEWCLVALEAEGGDLERATTWLRDRAPSRGESIH